MLTALKDNEIAFLLEHEEVFDALLDIAALDGFREVFGNMLLSEVIARYESALTDTADESDPVEMLKKLRGPSLFDDLNAEE